MNWFHKKNPPKAEPFLRNEDFVTNAEIELSEEVGRLTRELVKVQNDCDKWVRRNMNLELECERLSMRCRAFEFELEAWRKAAQLTKELRRD